MRCCAHYGGHPPSLSRQPALTCRSQPPYLPPTHPLPISRSPVTRLPLTRCPFVVHPRTPANRLPLAFCPLPACPSLARCSPVARSLPARCSLLARLVSPTDRRRAVGDPHVSGAESERTAADVQIGRYRLRFAAVLHRYRHTDRAPLTLTANVYRNTDHPAGDSCGNGECRANMERLKVGERRRRETAVIQGSGETRGCY